MELRMPVHRIIPFSNVEGMGNRTSIFTQGCNANCLYCHNSETIAMKSPDAKLYTVDELFEIIKGNVPFIRGITVSGGEATLHHKFLTQLFKKVKTLGITSYVDSNGFFDYEEISELIEVTDKFLYDVKAVGKSLDELCFSDFLHHGSKLVTDYNERFTKSSEHLLSLKKLVKRDKVEEVRLVYVKGSYDANYVIDKIAEIIVDNPEILLKLIRVHARGLPAERAKRLKGMIPSEKELDELASYAESKALKNIVKIY